MSREIDALIVNIRNGGEDETTGQWHGFPTTKEDLQQTLSEIGATCTGSHDVFISQCESRIEGLDERLGEGVDINELNYLAAKLENMSEAQHESFESVMQSTWQSHNVRDIINLTENLGCFDIQPAYSLEQYGEFLTDIAHNEFVNVIERMDNSPDPEMQELAAYIERLEAHFDSKSYATEIVKEENGTFTQFGYVTQPRNLEDIYHGTQDIPAEFQVFAYPEPEAPAKEIQAEPTSPDRPFAYVCSPYRGDVETNTEKARAYSRELYESGYTPIAPHLLFPQFLNDNNPAEREAGMQMAAALLPQCKVLAVCGGEITEGMAQEIQTAERLGIPILTLDVILPEAAHNRPPAASLSVLKQIADARAVRRDVPDKPATDKPGRSQPEL